MSPGRASDIRLVLAQGIHGLEMVETIIGAIGVATKSCIKDLPPKTETAVWTLRFLYKDKQKGCWKATTYCHHNYWVVGEKGGWRVTGPGKRDLGWYQNLPDAEARILATGRVFLIGGKYDGIEEEILDWNDARVIQRTRKNRELRKRRREQVVRGSLDVWKEYMREHDE